MFLSQVTVISFLIPCAAAFRLAKFNLDERQSLGFIGLPTPANALLWGSLVCGLVESGAFVAANLWWVILLTVFYASYLLISEIPMFALKFKHWGWKGNEIKYIFVISCIPLLLLFGVFSGIAFIIVWYIVLSKIAVLTKK
jgi:CDP-diacylglycerol--serine O-phosphatidyltransferase